MINSPHEYAREILERFYIKLSELKSWKEKKKDIF